MAKKDFKDKDTAKLFISAAEDPKEAPQTTTPEGFIVPKGYKLVKETKSERLQLLVRPTIKDGVKAEAEAQGLSVNELANNIFEEYLERKGRA